MNKTGENELRIGIMRTVVWEKGMGYVYGDWLRGGFISWDV